MYQVNCYRENAPKFHAIGRGGSVDRAAGPLRPVTLRWQEFSGQSPVTDDVSDRDIRSSS